MRLKRLKDVQTALGEVWTSPRPGLPSWAVGVLVGAGLCAPGGAGSVSTVRTDSSEPLAQVQVTTTPPPSPSPVNRHAPKTDVERPREHTTYSLRYCPPRVPSSVRRPAMEAVPAYGAPVPRPAPCRAGDLLRMEVTAVGITPDTAPASVKTGVATLQSRLEACFKALSGRKRFQDKTFSLTVGIEIRRSMVRLTSVTGLAASAFTRCTSRIGGVPLSGRQRPGRWKGTLRLIARRVGTRGERGAVRCDRHGREKLSAGEVKRVMIRATSALRACVRKGGVQRRAVRLRTRVDCTGHVMDSVVVGLGSNQKLGRCVDRIMRGLRFGTFRAAELVFVYPIR